MWNRFAEGLADIVAPEEGIREEKHATDQVCNRSLFNSSSNTDAIGNDDPEHEQYTYDLERALLQRKKQNEILAIKVQELEKQELEMREGEAQYKKQMKEQEIKLAQQKASIERLQAAQHSDGTVHTEDDPMHGIKSNQLVQEAQQSETQINTLAARCHDYKKDLAVLRDQVKKLQTTNEKLQDDKRKNCSQLAKYEQGYVDLLAEIEQIKAVYKEEKTLLMMKNEEHVSSIDNQRLYDLEAQLKTSEADKAVAEQDAKKLQHDLDALESVLHQFQVDNKAQKEHVIAVEAELERVKKELEMCQPFSESSKGTMNDLEQVIEQLAKKTHECDQLREALRSTTTQYNSERDVIDKRLAAQLVVTYVNSNNKGEVLELMARMMGFTEDQKRRVGMGCPIEGNGGGGLFSSIIGIVTPGESGKVPVDSSTLEGKNFADIWSEYLLEEASEGQ